MAVIDIYSMLCMNVVYILPPNYIIDSHREIIFYHDKSYFPCISSD